MPCVAEVVNRSLKADCTDFKRGYVKIFNGLHDNCIGTLRLLIMKTISNLSQKHSRPVLFQRDFQLSNCFYKVNFTN